MNATANFFEEPTEQSRLKAEIVSKYFTGWATVIGSSVRQRGPNGKIGYIDLFAGPGKYKDGTKSTPILILEKVAANSAWREMLVSTFCDKDAGQCEELSRAISSIPDIGTLKYKPKIYNLEIDPQTIREFKDMNLIPSLVFLDPWGYKGLCLELVNALIKDWGCDCIFFLNYLRVNMAIENEKFREHVDAIFGKTRADELRENLPKLPPLEREQKLLAGLMRALTETHGKYVLKFRFISPEKDRTSHYLFFVTKGFRGYEIMKEIMAKSSSSTVQDVPTFEYEPTGKAKQLSLAFLQTQPLDNLAASLPRDLAGQVLTMQEIYEKHSVGTQYVKRNYKTVLMRLETEGKIIAEPPSEDRRKNTFSEKIKVSFPKTGTK